MKCDFSEECQEPAFVQCEGKSYCEKHLTEKFDDSKRRLFRILLSDELEAKLEALKDFEHPKNPATK